MYPYLFYYIFAFLVVLSLIFDLGKTGNRKQYLRIFNIVFLYLACLVAFRYGVGNDTANYMYFYDVVPNLKNITAMHIAAFRAMPGFTLLVSTLKTFSEDFVYLQILQALLFFSGFYLILKRLELRKFYLLLAFYGYTYFAEMSGMRECFGLSFCFFALYYYLERKYLKFYFLVTIGLMFHTGMFIFYVLPFVRLLKFKSAYSYFILLSAFGLIMYILPVIRDILSGFNDGSVSRYANSEGEGISVLSALVSLSYFFFIYEYCIKTKHQKEYNDIVYIGMVYVFFSLMGNLVPILYRYTSHLMVFFFYSIHLALSNMKKGNIAAVILAFLFFYTPTVRFFSGMNSNRKAYCSVFSSDKGYYTRIINTTDAGDIYSDD